MNQNEKDQICSLHKTGQIDLLKAIAMEDIELLRQGRIPKDTNEETLRNLFESVGGEKALLNYFNKLYDLASPER